MTMRARPNRAAGGDAPAPSPPVTAIEVGPGRLIERLYRHNARWLYQFVRRQLGQQRADAEDIVHDAYVRASRYGDEALARHPRALLRQIAVNLARDHMRRNVVRGGAPVDLDAVAASHNQLSVAPEQQHLVVLKQAILALPPRQRDVFVLSRFTGMTNADIALHLGISVKTVEWRLAQALQRCVSYMRD